VNATDFKSLFKEAADIAASVPESMHAAAFNRALDLLLQERGLTPPPHRAEKIERGLANGGEDEEQDRIGALMERLDRTKYPQVMTAGKVLDRALLLLKAARDHGIDGLTPHEVAKILTEKFRVATKDSSVRMALGSAGDKVDRVPQGQAFLYRLMTPGETYLALLQDVLVRPQRRAASRRRRSPRRKTKSNAVKTGEPRSVQAERQAGRPGPKRILEQLIDTGFLESGKTIGAIQQHIEEAEGRRYKAAELSPALLRLLREKKLVRERNADSQYEYKSY
jgi:hypothetical protein